LDATGDFTIAGGIPRTFTTDEEITDRASEIVTEYAPGSFATKIGETAPATAFPSLIHAYLRALLPTAETLMLKVPAADNIPPTGCFKMVGGTTGSAVTRMSTHA
jgi:hypothetical protein